MTRPHGLAPILLVIFSTLCLGYGPAPAVAADGDVHGSGSGFGSDKKMRVRDTPQLWSVIQIPDDIGPGVEFTLNCLIKAQTKKDKGVKGVKGTVATFAIAIDVTSGSLAFEGLVGQGIPFTTKKDGTAFVTTGAVVAGAWADAPSDNDTIDAWVNFTNNKRVKKTDFQCAIVIGE